MRALRENLLVRPSTHKHTGHPSTPSTVLILYHVYYVSGKQLVAVTETANKSSSSNANSPIGPAVAMHADPRVGVPEAYANTPLANVAIAKCSVPKTRGRRRETNLSL